MLAFLEFLYYYNHQRKRRTIMPNEKIYELLIKGKKLSLINLVLYGLSIKEIDSLCKEGILYQNGFANYEFKDAEGIFEYGKHMTAIRNYYKARRSFEICLTINPNDIEANKRFVLNSVFLERYTESINYLKPLQTSTNIHTRHDFNLWLFLLSHVIQLPLPLVQLVKKMKFEDIAALKGDPRYLDIEGENKIRKLVFEQEFYNASIIMKEHETSYNTIDNIIFYDLTKAARKKKKTRFYSLIGKLMKKDYQGVIDLIKLEKTMHTLTNSKESFLLVCEAIIKMRQTGSSTVPIEGEANDYLGNLCLNRYDLAISALENSHHASSFSRQNAFLHDCLVEANDLQKKSMECHPIEPINILRAIEEALEQSDYFRATNLIKIFLKSIGKEEYFYILENLIDISYLVGDPCTLEISQMLSNLSNGTFYFDTCACIYSIDTYLKSDRLCVAKCLIRMLGEALDQNHIDIPKNEVEDMITALNSTLTTKSLSQDQAKMFTY